MALQSERTRKSCAPGAGPDVADERRARPDAFPVSRPIQHLGSLQSVASLDIAFLDAAIRIYRFGIEISTNGDDWLLVWTGKSRRGTDEELQPFDIPNIAARYVRVVGQGNPVDAAIGLTEVKLRRLLMRPWSATFARRVFRRAGAPPAALDRGESPRVMRARAAETRLSRRRGPEITTNPATVGDHRQDRLARC